MKIRGAAVALLMLAAFTLPAADAVPAADKALQEEIHRLMQENAKLWKRISVAEQENNRLRDRLTSSDAELRQLRSWLGQIAADGKLLSPQRREERLGQMLHAVIESGVDMTLKADSAVAEVRKLMSDAAVEPVRRAQTELRLEALERAMLHFNSGITAIEHQRLDSCRILKVDTELGVAILSAGSVNGAFSGMIYRHGDTELKLIGVRPHASAAIVTKGKLSDLSTGMTVSSAPDSGAPILIWKR